MISEQELNRICTMRTFQRARQIASSPKNILTKRCRYEASETILNAFVASSHGWDETYRTSVTLDEDNDIFLDYSCTCPDFLHHGTPCKHCVALTLDFNQHPESFMGFKQTREPDTSTCIAELMRKTERIDDAFDPFEVTLTPIFSYGYKTWSVHFKISGGHGSYVVKNISEFVMRMKRGEYYSYGKNLAFTHSPEILTEQSRAIARVLDRALSTREHLSKSPKTSRSDTRPERELTLTECEVIDFLDVMGTHTFLVEGTDSSVRQRTTAHILNENPDILVSIIHDEHGGYMLARNTEAVFISHGDRLYIWQDEFFYRCNANYAGLVPFLCSVYDSEAENLYINKKDMPLFCATILPVIEQRLTVSVPEDIAIYRPVPCALSFYFDYDKKNIICEGWATYGETAYHLFDVKGEGTGVIGPLRNERLENRARSLVTDFFATGSIQNELAKLPLSEEKAVTNLLFGGLTQFQKMGETFTTSAFDNLINGHNPRVVMGISLSGNLINLTIASDDVSSEELAEILDSYRQKKHYHRLKNDTFIDIEELDLSELDRISRDLNISLTEIAQGTIELPAYRAFYLDDELHNAERDGSFDTYLKDFRTVDKDAYEVPGPFASILRPYQVEGFRWMNTLCDMGFGGVLADEMGLGKSIQTIAYLYSRREEARRTAPSLIVCPASLVYNWMNEFERFAPDLNVVAVAGSKPERMKIRETKNVDVFVTSYDLLRIDIDSYEERTFYTMVLDEAQYIKNHGTLTARSVKRVSALHRMALSGTPMENRLSEIWSMFDFLMPGFLGSYMHFRDRFELDIMGGDEDAAHRLQSLIGPFMLRRLKTEVLPDLPDKLETPVYVQLTDKQQEMYRAHEQNLRESLTVQKNEKKSNTPTRPDVEVLAELMRLRQICCDPRLIYEDYTEKGAKLDAMMDLIDSALDGGEKTLVFSQFTSFLSLIAEELDRRGISYYTITGATPKMQRVEMVNTFNEDNTPVFLVSLKAGGTGLNLTGASVVIHADPWWNAAAQNQATDRAHRIGQERVVSVHRIIAKGTIEERIMHLQDMKNALADQVISSEGISLSNLTRDDLIDLLNN